MTPRLSGYFSISVKSLLGIARQWSREKFEILFLKPRSHVRILTYRPWAIKADLCQKLYPGIVSS